MNQPRTCFAGGINPFAGISILTLKSIRPKYKLRVKGKTEKDLLFDRMRFSSGVAEIEIGGLDSFRKQIRRYLNNHNIRDQYTVRQRKDGNICRLWLELKVEQ